MTIEVMLVDDSAVVRQVLSQVFTSASGIHVLDVAHDPIMAIEKLKKHWPDVIVLDVEMPKMDGITFLKHIMSTRPTPVVICSSLTQKGADVSMQAMAAGAVGVIAKPTGGVKAFLEENSKLLIDAVRGAAQAKMSRVQAGSNAQPVNKTALSSTALPNIRAKLAADVVLDAPTGKELFQTTERIVAIGTSTGGTQALEAILTSLPRTCPGMAIVQHMPEQFTAAFAKRLNSICQIEVKEAVNGDRIIPGRAIIAPGGRHMTIKRSGAFYHVEVIDGPPVSRHRPSVDVLFRSAAKASGRNALGIIMTGMGDDGAKGLKEMHDAGAHTIAQDENSCVVFGMPKEAIKLGAATEIMPLDQIAKSICKYG
ncbi:chemotaxis response regulator protein-glutamate methylesterase [Chitinibacter bivalviorum]|uniref:Protein-glutamate methylesterase/protein-glutamine glutaminase n=1 Tax=Chitinibacter bivalviorum TaxID=2739434 RepID=A0A7H9BKV8_9NEIS|nr:chemotaxis response regulator protein-glutamate methylesterase [Chitinibacter bivalviorum]QLG89310.1 chemotaxis response regulator protein-glutamate methylesterase [Chitinibacter bivalviorum]